MTNTIIEENCVIDKGIIGENSIIRNGTHLGEGEEKENNMFPDIYNAGLVVVGSDVVIPSGRRVGKNVAIWNHVKESDIDGDINSGETVFPKNR